MHKTWHKIGKEHGENKKKCILAKPSIVEKFEVPRVHDEYTSLR